MFARGWLLGLMTTLLLKSTACSGRRCPPCVEQPRQPATVVVAKEPAPCHVPADPTPVALKAKPSGTPGSVVVTTDALRELGGYLAGVRAVIEAQATCIKARSGLGRTVAP